MGNASGHAHKSRKSNRGSGARNSPVVITSPHPIAWAVAREMTGGKTTHLFTKDGYVIIANTATRPAWM